jgi:hypothetical protein
MVSIISINNTNLKVIDFPSDPKLPIVFRNHAFESLMNTNGVKIPEDKKADFGNRSVVYLGEPNFKEAFLSFYFPQHFNPEEYCLKINSA